MFVMTVSKKCWDEDINVSNIDVCICISVKCGLNNIARNSIELSKFKVPLFMHVTDLLYRYQNLLCYLENVWLT